MKSACAMGDGRWAMWRRPRVRCHIAHRTSNIAHGFSLVELVIALAIVSIAMVSLTSAVMLASRAIPAADDASVTAPHTGRILSRIVDDLRFAIEVTERTETAIAFIVADRDMPGDAGYGSPEHIRYAWAAGPDGATGALTRQYNDGPAVELAGDVHEFELLYETRDVTETYPGPIVEDSLPTLLASHLGNNREEAVTGTNWYGQHVASSSLTLNADAVSWRPEKVEVGARGRYYEHVILGLLGIVLLREEKEELDLQVQIRIAGAGNLPTGALVTKKDIYYNGDRLGGYYWWPASFPPAAKIPAGTPASIVVRKTDGGTGGYVLYDNDNNPSGFLETSNGDSDWEYRDNEALTYKLWGYQSIQRPDQQLTRHYLTAVNIALQVGDEATRRQTTAVRLLNTPEDLDLRWTCDGAAPGTTVTSPRHDFNLPVTAHLRFRHDGPGATTFRLNADWRGDGRCAPLYAALSTNPDPNINGQILVVGCGDSVLMTRSDLSKGSQNVRLLIDPTRTPGTINIQVNGEEDGTTYQYTRTSVVHDDRQASIAANAYSGWKFVSIRVGGTP